MRLPGRRRPPRGVLAALPAEPGDRVLAWAPYDGGHLVATLHGLCDLPDGGEPALLHWDEVDRAELVEGRFVVRQTPLDGRAHVRSYPVQDPTALGQVVRDRVTASIVVNNAHRLRSSGTVRVLARRREGEDALRWLLAFDRPRDAADPAARAEAEAFLRDAKESVGER